MGRLEENEAFREFDNPWWIDIKTIKVVQDWYVKVIEYCTNCWSTDIKTSKKWNQYCGKICREKNKAM